MGTMYEPGAVITSSGDQYFPNLEKEELPIFTQMDQSEMGLFPHPFVDYPLFMDSSSHTYASSLPPPSSISPSSTPSSLPPASFSSFSSGPFTPPSCPSSSNNSPLTESSTPSPLPSVPSPPSISVSPPPLSTISAFPHSSTSSYSQTHSLLSTLSAPSTPFLSVPSPPSSSSSSSEAISSNIKRNGKRRRKDSDGPEANDLFIWTYYTAPSPVPPPVYHIYDSASQLITKSYDVVIKMEINATHSPAEDAWICYRQNQFKVNCALKQASHVRTPTYVSKNGALVPISRFCVKLYAIKEDPNVINEVQVGIHHMGKSRTKKEKSIISITPFVDDRVEFSNIQFEKSNAVKGQKIDYFRIVVAFFAQSADLTCYHIFSKISPRLIVRSQNPGFYKDTEQAADESIPTASSITKIEPPTPGPGPDSGTKSGPDTLSSSFFNKIKSLYGASYNASPQDPPPNPANYSFAVQQPIHDLHSVSVNSSPDPSPPQQQEPYGGGWQYVNGNMVYNGKVGINTNAPAESLTVNGNIMLTGNLFKPSDVRIKSNIEPVDPVTQLNNIRNLKIYDYLVKSRKERGVLAQELAQHLPNAVHVVGDVHIDDVTIPNFLLVNERVLLFENIGATQQLDKEVELDKRAIEDITTRVDTLEVTSKDSESVKSLLYRMVDVVTDTEKAPKVPVEGAYEPPPSWSENVTHGLTLFSIGPARTMWIVGFFVPLVWIIGSLYIFSKVPTRRAGGIMNLVMWLIFMVLSLIFDLSFLPGKSNVVSTIFLAMGIVLGIAFVVVRRIRKRIEKRRRMEKLKRLRLDLIDSLAKQSPTESKKTT